MNEKAKIFIRMRQFRTKKIKGRAHDRILARTPLSCRTMSIFLRAKSTEMFVVTSHEVALRNEKEHILFAGVY